MSTVQKLAIAVKQLQQAHISKAKARRFLLGVELFSIREFTSLNAVRRSLGLNRFTGENRIRRLVTDQTLAQQLQQLLVSEALASKRGHWYCSLDHSQFGPFCIAILAVSHRKGRAIPIWCPGLTSPKQDSLLCSCWPWKSCLSSWARRRQTSSWSWSWIVGLPLLACLRYSKLMASSSLLGLKVTTCTTSLGSQLVERTHS